MIHIYVTENEVCSRHDHMAKGRKKTVKLVILAAIFLTFWSKLARKKICLTHFLFNDFLTCTCVN